MTTFKMAFSCQTGNSLTKLLTLSILIVCGFSFNSFAQKVKIKDDVATIDGADYVTVKTSVLSSEVSIYELGSDDELIFIQYFSYADPTKVTSGNPQGMVRWVELKFLTENLVCEISSRSPKALIKVLYENDIFVDGKLSPENVQKFVAKYGTSFTDNKPSTIIIR